MRDGMTIHLEDEIPLKRSDFETQEEYYWTYQYRLAAGYYIPLLNAHGFCIEKKRILDIGCGLGGFPAAMADNGAAECVGIEIDTEIRRPGTNNRPNLKYILEDITSADASIKVGTNYDLIVLHDVIEHVPLVAKEQFLSALKQFCHPGTVILVTFPPFYSPFGLHQQSLLKTKLRIVPFLGWVPLWCLKPILRLLAEDADAYDLLKEIKDSRMTIRSFKKMLARLGYSIEFEQYYLVRPTHEIRYGWRTRISRIKNTPVLSEVANSGALYLLRLS